VVYVYIDEQLAFKFHIKNTKQPIGFEFELLPTAAAQLIKFEFFDPSDCADMNPDDSEGDEDKTFYTHVGDTKLKVDKILSNLLIDEKFDTIKNIVFQDEMAINNEGGDES
jgi:hypothetical protein